MANFGLGYYSSAYNVALTLNTSQNVNLYNYIIANSGWRNTSKKLRAIITIPTGAVISSSNPLLPALTIPANGAASFRSYDFIMIINNGTIAGAGGAGGVGGNGGQFPTAGGNGETGGTALLTSRIIYLNNLGNIYAGGGGGGGGGGGAETYTLGGQVNSCCSASNCDDCPVSKLLPQWNDSRNYDCTGANTNCSQFCSDCFYCPECCDSDGNGKTLSGGITYFCRTKNWVNHWGGAGGAGQGVGPAGAGALGTDSGGAGGNGGTWGQMGLDGVAGTARGGGLGGNGGYAINGNSQINYINTGVRLGGIIN